MTVTAMGRQAVLEESGERFVIREFPVPEPEPGAALIRMTLASLCGSSIHRRQHSATRAAGPRSSGGHEGVGRIAALGEGVTTDFAGKPLAVGDRVVFSMFTPCGRCHACLAGKDWCCPHRRDELGGGKAPDMWPYFRGTFGEFKYSFPRSAIFKVPDDVPDTLVASLNCAVGQVYHGLEASGPSLGESVVIQGAGGLGLYAIAIARERGAGQIIVVEGVPERIETARAFGPDHIIDLRETQEPDQRVRRVKELTDGWGADVVLEVAGNVHAVEEGIRMLGQGGRFVSVGNVRAGSTYAADPELWVHSNLTIVGNNNFGARHLKGALDFISRARSRYPFERIASHQYPLERINEAFADQATGRVVRAGIIP